MVPTESHLKMTETLIRKNSTVEQTIELKKEHLNTLNKMEEMVSLYKTKYNPELVKQTQIACPRSAFV